MKEQKEPALVALYFSRRQVETGVVTFGTQGFESEREALRALINWNLDPRWQYAPIGTRVLSGPLYGVETNDDQRRTA